VPPKGRKGVEGRMQYAHTPPSKARDDLVSVERRMEKKLAAYLQGEYRRAASAVGG